MTAAEVTSAIKAGRLIAILRAARSEHLLAAAQVLVDEGVDVLEFPLTGPHVLGVISEAADTLQGRAFVGAGTVRTVDDARQALQAGASFLVSPSLSVPVVEHALARDTAVLPGTFTPTEIDLALQAGVELVKLFPASAHDPEFVRQVRVPLPRAGVVPTGGVGLDEAAHWLAAGAVALGIGSPLTGDSLETGNVNELRRRVKEWKAAVA